MKQTICIKWLALYYANIICLLAKRGIAKVCRVYPRISFLGASACQVLIFTNNSDQKHHVFLDDLRIQRCMFNL